MWATKDDGSREGAILICDLRFAVCEIALRVGDG